MHPCPHAIPAQSVGEKQESLQILDRDGQVEEMHVKKKPASPRQSAVKLQVHQERVIDQVNYAGRIVESIQFVDLEADDRQEVLVPFVRRDSLFLSVVGADGQKRNRFFITHGFPRREPVCGRRRSSRASAR